MNRTDVIFFEGEKEFIKNILNDYMDKYEDQDLFYRADKALKILDGELSLLEYKVFIQNKTDAVAEAEIQASKNAWNNLYVAGTIDKKMLDEELKKLD